MTDVFHKKYACANGGEANDGHYSALTRFSICIDAENFGQKHFEFSLPRPLISRPNAFRAGGWGHDGRRSSPQEDGTRSVLYQRVGSSRGKCFRVREEGSSSSAST